jgi:hypothetical protein
VVRPGRAQLLRWYPQDLVEEADAALAALGLADRGGTRADRLSGGERQKVALARPCNCSARACCWPTSPRRRWTRPRTRGACFARRCAPYPQWVGDGVVERSNRILTRLRSATTAALRAELAALPMWQRADVGALRIGLVHGDAQSLAGWGFAQEHLSQASHREQVREWFSRANVDAFASTHTCLPVFQRLRCADPSAHRWVFNNGAAGMPNFAGDTAGLVTRFSTRPLAGGLSRAGVTHAGIFVDALAVEVDAAEAQRRFLAQWPLGSDAHASYFSRIVDGPSYRLDQVVRLEN